MNFYQVLVDQKLPSPVLTYSSDMVYVRGELVVVPLKDKKIYGVVLQELTNHSHLETFEIKPISDRTGVILGEKQLRFIHNFKLNTFNNLNVIFEAFIQSYNNLGILDHKKLLERNYEGKNKLHNKNEKEKAEKPSEEIINHIKAVYEKQEKLTEIDFVVENNSILRIRNIIRIALYEFIYAYYVLDKSHISMKELLIIFPEQKRLDKYYLDLLIENEYNIMDQIISNSPTCIDYSIVKYNGAPTKKSKDVVRRLFSLTSQNTLEKAKLHLTPKFTVVFTTRAGMFLPFNELSGIVIVDEANSMYIQDQNSLYYDTRDLLYIMSQTYKCPLVYTSPLPSVRLLNYYNQVDQKVESTISQPKISVTKKSRYDEYDLLSDDLLRQLKIKEEYIMDNNAEDIVIFD
jgi:primosomal protein N'